MPITSIDSQLKRNIFLTVIAGAATTIIFNLTNPFFSLFVLRLGGTNYHVAWLSSLPGLAAVLALIPGGAFVDQFTYKKNITCLLIAASRFFYFCLALVPFLPPAWQATTFVILIGMMRLPGSVSEIAWQSFFADFVPEIHRGYALAQKQRISTIIGMIVTFLAGQILSHIPGTDLERLRFYQAFFIIAFIVGCIEVYANLMIKEPCYENEEETKALSRTSLKKRFQLLFSSFKNIPQAKRFLIFAICSIIFHFGWQMGWPLFSLYQIKHLNATEAWLATISVITSLTSALSYNYWNKFANKYGNDITLAITGLGMAFTPVLYASSKTLPILASVTTIVGISTAGFILTLMNITLLEAPKFQRTLYIACYNTAINISAIFAPNVGVYINDRWGIHTALLAAAFFRFLGVIAFFIRYKYHTHEKKQHTVA
ncbi:hypothetical protein BBF96_08525 [Anoxybacter fermentans]|uniref:Major facilitator superfamily (MFS) profile domain-containing protein n=1 Tax=Anoxybacter fermentans TaxID=1323375 RepID=A0A3Q9HQI9_9FIRM|nr:MFS transporter [Anoxybacter fermentans]AZR73423.1 hypothetical protein BBF96_08525 [Anoxybacter fermentans]